MDYKEYIVKIINDLCPGNENLEVLKPPSDDMGDFSVPTFKLKIEDIKAPNEKAEYIKNNLEYDTGVFMSVDTVGGYVNFTVNKVSLAIDVIERILDEKTEYGSTNIGNGEKLLIEHTSINPNASPHIGRARNSVIGDFLARLYKFVGYDVETHYFINDMGKQIAMLVVGVEKFADIETIDFNDMLDLYIKVNEESKTDPEIEKKSYEYLNALENGDEEVKEKFNKVTEVCLIGQKKIFSEMGVEFDVFTRESDFVFGDEVDNIIKDLEKTGKLKEDENGRYYVDLSDYNIATKEPVFVLTRQDKTSLYQLRDIAYTIMKMDVAPKHNYIVLGEDHNVYFQQLCAVLDVMGFKSPELIVYSFILLKGEKMATREGTVVLLEDLIDEIKQRLAVNYKERDIKIDDDLLNNLATACIKYNILSVSRKKNVNFDIDIATNFLGDSAIYLLYNYARINSILEKVDNKLELTELVFEHELEHSLIKDLYDFPEVINNALNTNESLGLTKYLYNLTQKFAKYYTETNILNEKDQVLKASRLMLLISIKIVLENGMQIIGIKPVKKM